MEALVAAGILGIALMALVQLHQSSMRGTIASSRIGEAAEVARALADIYSMQTTVATPLGCGPGQNNPLIPEPTCANIITLGTTLPATPCVMDVTPSRVGDLGNPINPNERPYRVALFESENPADTAGAGFRISAYVCWTDADSSGVRQVATHRLVY